MEENTEQDEEILQGSSGPPGWEKQAVEEALENWLTAQTWQDLEPEKRIKGKINYII